MSYTDFANAICHKTQKAAQAMVQARIAANELESLLPVANVFGGIGKSPITAKRVVCLSQRAVIAENFEGNWMADLSIVTSCPFEDIEEDDFHELAGQINAFFFQSPETVATRLSNATIKYTAQNVFPREQGWELVRDKETGKFTDWMSETTFQVLCSGSVIE